jgi:cytochrome c oxidase subunit 4
MGTYVKVWLALLGLTGLLVGVSRLGPAPALALAGLLLITPLKAGLVLYFFMHLRDEGPLLRAVPLIALGTLLIFFALLFTDVAYR